MVTRLFKHVKTGHYYWVISFSGILEKTQEQMVIYCRANPSDELGIGQRVHWIRPYKEFFDGRFKEVKLKE